MKPQLLKEMVGAFARVVGNDNSFTHKALTR